MYTAQAKAINKLHRFIEADIIVKGDHCERCQTKKLPLVAHHHLGYHGFNALRVIWLCRRCHKKEHIKVVKKTHSLTQRVSFSGSYLIWEMLRGRIVSAWLRKAIAEKLRNNSTTIIKESTQLIKGSCKTLVAMVSAKTCKKLPDKKVDLTEWLVSAVYEKMCHDGILKKEAK